MAADGSPLVDVGSLAGRLAAAGPLVLVDARWRLGGPPPREGYLRGHLPGAVLADLDTQLAGAPGVRGRHPLPDPGALQEALRSWGVRADSGVVVYDESDATSAAARAWWLLRWAGLRDVAVLDGGLAAWVAAGGALETGDVTPPPGDVVVTPGAMRSVDADQAAAAGRSGLLLDVRVAARYRGETEPVDPVAGHIPGALNAPAAGNVGADGRFADVAAIAARFSAYGAVPGSDVVVSCGSGVVAAQTVLALSLVGVDAALYPGSWSEWVADPTRPVATGPDPG